MRIPFFKPDSGTCQTNQKRASAGSMRDRRARSGTSEILWLTFREAR